MATYKVIQDIEAEDKLLGPLSLRQFIYAIIVVVCGFIAFKLATAAWYLAIPFLPIMLFFGVLAAPLGHDQSSEVWLLAKIRFFLKPHRRIWDQSGMKQLVTITAPKRIEKNLTKQFSQTEVRSRLSALANTIDSRGWAVKNINVNLFSEPGYVTTIDDSDRLVGPGNLPQDVPSIDVQATDDMLDERANPTAQHLEQMITASEQAHRQQLMQQMQTPKKAQKKQDTPPDYWFLNGGVDPAKIPPGYAAFNPQVVAPGQPGAGLAQATPDEEAVLKKIKSERAKPNPAYGHMRTIQPLSAKGQAASAESKQPKTQSSTPTEKAAATPNPALIELANNDDLNVATIARQANKSTGKKPGNDEVVVNLR